jgi:predicted transposase/invertase (TIGR01784 family)
MGRLIRFDWAIKNILRNKANFDILEGFLSELLYEDVKIQEILESESNQETDVDKFNRVDLLAKNSKDELILIEVQNNTEYDYFHRMAYGASKLITQYLHKGDEFGQIKKVIGVSIVYFDLGQGEDYVYHGKTNFIGLHKKDILKLNKKQKELYAKTEISDIYPEFYLLKVNQFNDVAKDTLDEWIYFLKNSEIEQRFKAKGIEQAHKKLDVLNMEESDRKKYDRYLDDLHYHASMANSTKIEAEELILAKGIAKGKQEEKRETAKKLKAEGLPAEAIARITGLTPTEITAS